MVTFDEIMSTVEREQMAVLIRNCLDTSVKEAKQAAKNHPAIKIQIFKTADSGTCIAIKPRRFTSTGDEMEAIYVKGHENVRRIFKKRKP